MVESATKTPPKDERRHLHGQYHEDTVVRPCNPHARTVADLRKAANEAISPAMVQKVLDTLFQLALTGNIPAARLFLQYAIGRPAKAESPDRVNVEEWELRKESAVHFGETMQFVGQPPLDFVNKFVNASDAVSRHNAAETTVNILKQPLNTSPQPAPATTENAATPAPAPEQTVSPAEQTVDSTKQTVRAVSPTPETHRANGSHGAKTPVVAPTQVAATPNSVPDTDRVA